MVFEKYSRKLEIKNDLNNSYKYDKNGWNLFFLL